jgi:hypothetical protein
MEVNIGIDAKQREKITQGLLRLLADSPTPSPPATGPGPTSSPSAGVDSEGPAREVAVSPALREGGRP